MSAYNRKMNDKVKSFSEFVNENFKNEFTINHFIVGDEVYLVNGDGKPFGKIVKIGTKNIFVKLHDTNKETIVVKKPTELYLGKEWHEFNTKK